MDRLSLETSLIAGPQSLFAGITSERYLQLFAMITLVCVLLTLMCERVLSHAKAEGRALSSPWLLLCFWGRFIAKSLASLGFLFYFYIVCLSPQVGKHPIEQEAIWIALIASALGDVLLLGRRERDFLAGLISFFIAHLAYVYAFIVPMVDRLTERNVAFVSCALIAMMSSVSLLVYRHFKPEIELQMRAPSLAYTLVISLMVAAAFTHAIYLDCLTIGIGALMFWLSDLAVAMQQFQGYRLPLGGLYVRYWGLPLYYLAQLVMSSERII